MPLSSDQVRAIQTPLRPLAPTLANDVGGVQSDRVVNLLSLSLLAKPAAEASELATAIGDTTNADKIKSTESYWIANRPADPAPPPTAAQATIDPETAKSRLAQASQTNSTSRLPGLHNDLWIFHSGVHADLLRPLSRRAGSSRDPRSAKCTGGERWHRDILPFRGAGHLEPVGCAQYIVC